MLYLNEGLMKKYQVHTILICRLGLFAFLYLYGYSGFPRHLTDDELNGVFFCIAPITILYITIVAKYTVSKNRYFNPGMPVSTNYFLLSLIPLVTLHLFELCFILYRQDEIVKRYFFENVSILYVWISVLECILAVYAGLRLSALFALNSSAAKE